MLEALVSGGERIDQDSQLPHTACEFKIEFSSKHPRHYSNRHTSNQYCLYGAYNSQATLLHKVKQVFATIISFIFLRLFKIIYEDN